MLVLDSEIHLQRKTKPQDLMAKQGPISSFPGSCRSLQMCNFILQYSHLLTTCRQAPAMGLVSPATACSVSLGRQPAPECFGRTAPGSEVAFRLAECHVHLQVGNNVEAADGA